MAAVESHYLPVKILNRTYADKLMTGQVFMRRIREFGCWNNFVSADGSSDQGLQDGMRSDDYEGTCYMAQEGAHDPFGFSERLPDNLKETVLNVAMVHERQLCTKLFCMTKLEFDKANHSFFQINSRLAQLGDTAVIIHNPQIFYQRLQEAFYRRYKNLYALSANTVVYRNLSGASVARDIFTKSDRYRWQNEVQIAAKLRDDITEIQYLLLVLQKILSDGYDCTVLISAGKHEETRYTPITNDNYFRLAQNLYFYRDNDDLNCCLAEIYRCFLVYCQINTDRNRAKWIPLPRKYARGQFFGRIIPQIPITHHSYNALATSYSYNTTNNDWLSLLHDLCSGYFERLSGGVLQAQCEKIRTYQNSDSNFETLLFLGVCNNISKQDVNDPCFDIESLHEDCMNFAQGVLQLVENVVHHVIGEDDTRGCGILTIRHRRAEDAKKLYLNEDAPSSNAKYFIKSVLIPYEQNKNA